MELVATCSAASVSSSAAGTGLLSTGLWQVKKATAPLLLVIPTTDVGMMIVPIVIWKPARYEPAKRNLISGIGRLTLRKGLA